MRQIDDPIYATILEDMRQGHLTEAQRQTLRSKILGNDVVAMPEWRNAIFLVQRNQLRVQLNFDATREYANDNHQPIIYCCAEDSYKKVLLQGTQRRIFLSASDTKENALCGILPLSIGMKVALTVNFFTKDGLANGAQGILRQVIYDQESIDYTNSRGKDVVLKKAPKYVVVELIGGTPGAYDSLPIYLLKPLAPTLFGGETGAKFSTSFSVFNFR